MKKIAVIHYMPLEYYPPITNLLDLLGIHKPKVKVWTSQNNKNRTKYTCANLEKIIRNPFPKANDTSLKRLLKYFWFNLNSFIGLIRYSPDVIIYYESYSVFPVYLYSLIFGANKDYCIHYHEYESPEDYSKGMKLVAFYHKLERNRLYKLASWISQTNQDRLNFFKSDHPHVSDKKLHFVPNFPPKHWLQFSANKDKAFNTPLKTVYVGSLSLKDTFIAEYCNWVITQKGAVTLDIYAFNLHTDTLEYLRQIKSPFIQFYEKGVEYNELPVVLSNYDVGVILYKGNTKNYIYNAPNKLFEYLACNLSVLYPDVMAGIHPYANKSVVAIDFLNIPSIEDILLTIEPIEKNNLTFTAEQANEKLLNHLVYLSKGKPA